MAADARPRVTAAGIRRQAVTVVDPPMADLRTAVDLRMAVDRTAVDMGGDIDIALGLSPA